MDKYMEKAALRILKDLDFDEKRLGLLGKVLSLEGKKGVKKVEMEKDFDFLNKISLRIWVEFGDIFRSEKEMIEYLKNAGFPVEKMASYSPGSYGLEDDEKLDIHFGCHLLFNKYKLLGGGVRLPLGVNELMPHLEREHMELYRIRD
jgi:hypothetical protein